MPWYDVYEFESRLQTGELRLCAGLPCYTLWCLLFTYSSLVCLCTYRLSYY